MAWHAQMKKRDDAEGQRDAHTIPRQEQAMALPQCSQPKLKQQPLEAELLESTPCGSPSCRASSKASCCGMEGPKTTLAQMGGEAQCKPLGQGEDVWVLCALWASDRPLPGPCPSTFPSLPFCSCILKAAVFNRQHSFISRTSWFSVCAAHQITVITLFEGNEDLNSFTRAFQSLQRSSSSSQMHTKKSVH